MDRSPAVEIDVLQSLGWVDITALVILLVFFVLGLFRGLVWQLSRILTLIVAYLMAGLYGHLVATRISGWFGENVPESLPLYISYVFVFLGVLVVISVIAYFLEKLVNRTGLSFYNRLGGGILGVGTGACVVLAMLAGIMMFCRADSGIVQAAERSRSMGFSKDALDGFGEVVPEDVLKVFGLPAPTPPAGDGENR